MLVLLFLIKCLFVVITKTEYQAMYDLELDHIEEINSYTFESNVLRSNRATILEHYASWCGTCQAFKITWKEFANLTRLWHAKVLRVAAIDCVSIVNDIEVCRKNDIASYPRFRMYWGNYCSIIKNNHIHVYNIIKQNKLISLDLTWISMRTQKVKRLCNQ
jgi:hypothetical protein